MKEIIEKLAAREKYLMKVRKKKEKELLKAPEGSLRLCNSGNRTQYYHRKDEKDVKGSYIREENHHLASMLAQKDYNKKIISAAAEEEKVIKQFLNKYPKNNVEDVYENLHEKRQCLITPIEEPDEIFIQNWLSHSYEGKGFFENSTEYYTRKGERVRSKSEWMIAELLHQEGIPYRYECPVYLDGIGTVYTDFIVLNVRLRKEFYIEHFGLMDDPDYLELALNKISAYQNSGIYLGENLLITYETRKNPLNPKLVEDLIDHYLK